MRTAAGVVTSQGTGQCKVRDLLDPDLGKTWI